MSTITAAYVWRALQRCVLPCRQCALQCLMRLCMGATLQRHTSPRPFGSRSRRDLFGFPKDEDLHQARRERTQRRVRQHKRFTGPTTLSSQEGSSIFSPVRSSFAAATRRNHRGGTNKFFGTTRRFAEEPEPIPGPGAYTTPRGGAVSTHIPSVKMSGHSAGGSHHDGSHETQEPQGNGRRLWRVSDSPGPGAL